MSLILDAGGLIAYERGSRLVAALIAIELRAHRTPITHGGVVGQVWRGGAGRQARIAQLLAGTRVMALDDALGRRAGILLARVRASDVVDAAVVLLASDGDTIVTSDSGDLEPLVRAAGVHAELVAV